jgi:hypothetical protein
MRMPLLCLLLLALTAPLRADTWQTLSSDSGRFTVLLPGQAAFEQKVDTTPLGPIYQNTYTWKDGTVTIVVDYNDLPPTALLLGGAPMIFDEVRQGFIRRTGASVTGSTDLTLLGNPGREIAFILPGPPSRQGRARAYLVGSRLYVLTYSGGQPEGADAQKFFDSFGLLGQ